MTINPVVTARHFAHRFQCLPREVIKGTGQPIGKVLDLFWRIELNEHQRVPFDRVVETLEKYISTLSKYVIIP